ncbi:MAG: patatin-like phospholipase family protein [Rhodocyclaceae bacterium]|nr:patatin-like phospholipase family protein [Rhodocyclaceae bacterium]
MRRLCVARLCVAVLPFLLSACVTLGGKPPDPAPAKPVIALALGGGAAKGFAHIGVIKALEAQGIVPDIIVGTSAGSVVGAMYASGKSGFELQQLAITLDESAVSDWSMPDRGVLKGDALATFINKAVSNTTIERLPKKFGAVATDLASGEPIVFRSGDTGTAVRASSSVPGVFQPVAIRGREYVDGGLVSPVPVRFAREMGADFVIAVDISNKPQAAKTKGSLDILLQTFAIMGQSLNRSELPQADVVIRPDISQLAATDFKTRHQAVLEGEKATAHVLPTLKAKLESWPNPIPRAR